MACTDCKYYSELKYPRAIDDVNKIYGYCFKNAYNMGKGFPVYIPDGICNDMKKIRVKYIN